jgi:hypothetical protein
MAIDFIYNVIVALLASLEVIYFIWAEEDEKNNKRNQEYGFRVSW